jgi:hypothetical protein
VKPKRKSQLHPFSEILCNGQITMARNPQPSIFANLTAHFSTGEQANFGTL